MKNRKHTPEQMIRKLAEGEKLLGEGQSIEEVSRHLEITESTWHRWRNQYGGMKADDAKQLKELEKENQRLKRIVADQALDIDMLKELNRGKLLTPDRRRRAVVALREQFGVSERRACRVDRPAPVHPAPPSPDPKGRGAGPPRLPPGLLQRRPRWGWRRAATAAREAGWVVNNKRIHRLWRDRRPAVPYRKRKRPLRGIGVRRRGHVPDPAQRGVGARLPVRPDHRREDAQALNVIDEHTRECLAIDVDRSIDADGVVACLDRLAGERGAPRYVRFDHGPEFIAYAVATGAGSTAPTPCSSTPGHPGRTPGSRASTAGCGTST